MARVDGAAAVRIELRKDCAGHGTKAKGLGRVGELGCVEAAVARPVILGKDVCEMAEGCVRVCARHRGEHPEKELVGGDLAVVIGVHEIEEPPQLFRWHPLRARSDLGKLFEAESSVAIDVALEKSLGRLSSKDEVVRLVDVARRFVEAEVLWMLGAHLVTGRAT